ncbi:MAG: hypothetical protein QOD01_2354 [Actinomycetota bacterium]|nr:hypothetical protein [Actinomycetota bacterium]
MKTENRPLARRRMPENLLLPIGDGAVFLVFTVLGLISHKDKFTPYHILVNFIPLTLSWFLIAVILDTYGKGGAVRVAANWLLAVVAGVAVRTWWVGSPNGRDLWVFLTVALVTNGAFLLVWRLAASRLPVRR